MRRFGEQVVAGQRYRLRPGAYAVLMRGDRFLLTHQAEPKPEFQLPGGGIDPGEGALTALNREVFEETGWSITGHRRLGAYRRFTYMPEYDRWAEKVCHIYLARPALRRGPPSEPGHTAFWMSGAEALAALSNSGDRHFMAKVLRNLG
ncbi:NUDIX domain-containing protein [Rhodobacter capsulatus]|jgi:8-oxo-dGTP diphosphatase|uniref:Hydrolase, NUDIX family n=1 Tax=Rhodobacter capsulatus (strain ATCC BAA-309 / NBRC 16581 / SB1003) TaxID=272942 RepID=D5AL95_RHOCB|nr:NUDIX hydrolase [Rhodobacter capsulatus]ADE83951.1 hydrolase, NUDIX family [Rhodobacter capsulatus SB 1003]ETD03069.1 NUDIX hydrolase [Rhodobacter capsulatus DE442]ETD79339.1 NUDIX hydrolase [Rhodobacter capsulatus R121]ETD84210.1 NUDIX hydrolase [Rhodobacter capsulatus B6]ETD86262.1 NUDIX hydrolase [Rhodobacter capsulatus YW1]